MKLKELQKSSPYTIKQTAELLNMPLPTLSNYLQETREPNIKVLKQFSKFYEVPIDYIVENTMFENKYLRCTKEQTKLFDLIIQLNDLNLIKAFSYISGLYAAQN